MQALRREVEEEALGGGEERRRLQLEGAMAEMCAAVMALAPPPAMVAQFDKVRALLLMMIMLLLLGGHVRRAPGVCCSAGRRLTQAHSRAQVVAAQRTCPGAAGEPGWAEVWRAAQRVYCSQWSQRVLVALTKAGLGLERLQMAVLCQVRGRGWGGPARPTPPAAPCLQHARLRATCLPSGA